MFNRALTALLPLLLVATSPFAAEPDALKAGVFDPPRMAPDFTLRGSNGADVRLSQYRGKVVVLGFGYTNCPDVCPTTLAGLAAARKKMGAAGNELQVIYLTVDPERDTPERLHQYLATFDPGFMGATGTLEQMAAVRKGYGISAVKKPFDAPLTGYSVHHSSYIYLIDRQGRLRGLMPFGRTVDDIVHDAKSLLKK